MSQWPLLPIRNKGLLDALTAVALFGIGGRRALR
jgi:hypothetical protein